MKLQVFLLKLVFICTCVLTFDKLVGSTPSTQQKSGTKIESTKETSSGAAPLSTSSIHHTNDLTTPPIIRNRRSNSITDKEQLVDDGAALDSAFLYNDEIMRNLFKTQTSKPLNYARSNFFLNLLKPRITRYNAWDDHSLMHFGKRSISNEDNKVPVKRSTESWLQNSPSYMNEKPAGSTNEEITSPFLNSEVSEIPNFEADLFYDLGGLNSADSTASNSINGEENKAKQDGDLRKKSGDPWHSMMSFGKKSKNSWDHNTLHFGKKNDPWHNMMSFGKRYENDWDYNTLHFGKRDPWDHSTLHFGKRDPWEHDTLHFGKRDPWEHDTLHFGKRDPWEHDTLHFGKRDPWEHDTLHFGKRDPWEHDTLHFGKKDDPWHNTMSFGKKTDPWHSMMSFGKRSDKIWDHNTLHFGKKNNPWHNILTPESIFGGIYSNKSYLDKRDDPWHNMMSFGKKSDNPWDYNTLHFGKKDEPWHNVMSFGKKSSNDNEEDAEFHNTKKDELWHSTMSFGKRADFGFDHNTLHFGKRDEPWHSTMSFGKKSSIPWDHSTLHFGKKNEPWHSMMSFGKKSDVPTDGIVDEFVRYSNPWEERNGMIFSKKLDPWDHDTLHFGKKANNSSDSESSLQSKGSTTSNRIKKRSIDTWDDHHTMHFDKKSESEENLNKIPFAKQFNFDDFENSFDVHKKFDWNSHNTMHFGKKADPWSYHDTMHFGKRSPWDNYNTMHFGKRNPWESHNTMHFGKRNPWESHNTMHFGKRNPWESHNTMHFGKRNPWESHNTMHFGKRSDTQHNEINSVSDKDTHNQANQDLKSKDISKTAEKDIYEKKYSLLKEGGLKSIYAKNSLENDELTGNPSKNLNKGQKVMIHSRIIKRSLKNIENPGTRDSILVKNDINTLGGFPSVVEEKHIGTLGITNTTPNVENNEKSKTYTKSSKLNSRIEKRSIDSEKIGSFKDEIAIGLNSESPLNNGNIKDDFPENVLHFGKRSVGTSDADEFELPKDEDEKRYNDYWNNHNTLHFGKKFDPWEDHSTLHFGKRNPWESHSTMHFGKRDPWESHNTLHFGKKFDPWESHTKMHFGKKDKIYPDEQNIEDKEDILSLLLDPSALEDVIQKNLAVEISDEQKREILQKLDNLKNLVNFHLDDENMDFQEKLAILKSYLKPILRTIISSEITDDTFSNPFLSLREYSDEDGNIKMMNDDYRNNPDLEEPYLIPVSSILSNTNFEDVFPNEKEDNDGELIDDYKFNENKEIINQKRSYLGKPELKRYFIPFQGPKSIVYPHAWFASQIRRSSLPRTREFSRNLELRMAEKKEDPFNSYMHFGRR